MSKNSILILIILLVLPSLPSSISSITSDDIQYDIFPFIRVYKNGTIQRFIGTDIVSASLDPMTGVQSKDITIVPRFNTTARLYLPRNPNPKHKIPVLVYFHGGGFFTESASSPSYHRHLNTIVAKANVVAVSVNYRLAPEYPLPVGYQDSWRALKWVFSHNKGKGKEPWIKKFADLRRVCVGGDSAGANIAHNMAIRAGSDKTGRIFLDGLFLNCPHFWGEKPLRKEGSNGMVKDMMESIWIHAYPNSKGLDDPLLNPVLDPNLGRLGCKRVLVYAAGDDILRDRGWNYKQALRKSKWRGAVKFVEARGAGHDFGVRFPDSQEANEMLDKFAAFLDHRRIA